MATPQYQTPIDKYRWLRAQMDKEGYTGPIAGYRPQGYDKVWHTESKLDPDVTYWKPNSVTDPFAPYAIYDNKQQRQSYWEDPRNVGAWHDYLALQEEDYITPSYVDRLYVDNAYQVLKTQNGNANWNDWKPLPFGHMLSYVAQQLPSPESMTDESFLNVPADGSKYIPGTDTVNPAYGVQAIQDYETVISQIQTKEQEQKARLSDELQQFAMATQEVSNPIIDEYKAEMEESAGADYLKLEPWEQLALPLASVADMKNRPKWSTTIGIVSQGLMASLGGLGIGAAAGGIVGGPVGSLVGMAVGGVGAFAASVDASLMARKGEEVPEWLINTNRLFNIFAEGFERTVGTLEIASELQKQKQAAGIETTDNFLPSVEDIKSGWEPFKTAWKAAGLQYESMAGTKGGGIGDWLIDTISVIAHKIDPEKNSGLKTGLGEVWQLHKGLSGPRALKGSGTIGRESQMELYGMLLDENNPVDPEAALAIFRDKYGFSGNLNDMIYQTLLDPSVVLPRVAADLGISFSTSKINQLQKQMIAEGPSPALTLSLENAMRMQSTMQRSLGNPIIDVSPYPVQMLFDLAAGRKNTKLRSTAPFFRSLTEYRVLKETGLLSMPSNTFEFKMGDQDLGTVFFGQDNSVTWKKPDGSVENMYANFANAQGFKFAVEDGKPVLYVNGQRASTLRGEEGIYTSPEGTTVIDAEFREATTTVTADVEMPDGSRATGVDVDPSTQTYEVHGQNGVTYVARAADGVVIDTLNSEGVSIHDPNRVIKINPVDIRVNGMTPSEIAQTVDTVAILGREYITPAQLDPKLTPRPILEKSASLSTKVKYFFGGLSKPTRETQVRKVLQNLHDLNRDVLYLSSNDFSQAVRLSKAIFNGNIENLDNVARKLANSTPIVTSAAIFKEAVNDPGLDTFVNIWNTPENKQRVAVIAKLSEAIKVTPEEFVKLQPADSVARIQKAIRDSGDTNMLAMAGTITEDSIKSLIKPYIGDDALPVTDKAATMKWLGDLDVKVEKLATEVYQVQPLNAAQKLLNIDKQLLSYGVFLAGYLRTNVLTNAAGTAGLASIPAYRSGKGIDKLWARLQINPPSEGATAYRQITHGALFDALWGSKNSGGVLKKISQGLTQVTKWQPFMAMSGYMETKAHEGADASFVEQAMAYFPIPEPSPEIKQKIINSIGEDGYKAWLTSRNKAYNADEMNAAYKMKDNLLAKYSSIENSVINQIYGDNTDLGTELITKLGLEKPLKDILENAKTPADVDNQIEGIRKFTKEQPDIRAAIEAQGKLFEGAEKVRQEGLVGLADVMFQNMDQGLEHWAKQQDFMEDVWGRASEFREKGDYFTYHNIIRQGKRDSESKWTQYNTNSLNYLKGALSVMDASDPKQQQLFIINHDIYKLREDAAKWRTDHWDAFFDNDDRTTEAFIEAQNVANLKADEFREKEFELMTSMAEEMATIFAESPAKTIAGVDLKDTAGEIVNLTKFYIDGDKKFGGYKTLANDITKYYDSVVGMDYHKRRSLAVKTFKTLGINIDKLRTELGNRAYNTWHRNHPEMQTVKKKQQPQPKTRAEQEADKWRQRYLAQQANNDIQRKAAKAEIDAQTLSKGTVTRSAFRDLISSTAADVDTTMALVDSVAEAWAFNNGKKSEEWFSNIGELAFVDAETFSAQVGSEILRATGMTSFDEAGKAVLTFAKNADITTLTHELGHVIETTLSDEQLGLVGEVFGGTTKEKYLDIRKRALSNLPLTPEEDTIWRNSSEGWAEGYQKWLMDDSVRLETPAKVAKIFKTISDWMHKLISHLSERISSMEFPQSLKDLYEKVSRVVDTADVEANNSRMMATLPTGVEHVLIDADNVRYPVTAKLIDLDNIINSHNTDGTLNSVYPSERQPRTYNQLFVQKNASELNPIKLLEKNSGFATGPIIVNSSGEVMVGNHRAGMMRIALMDYPEMWKAYQEELVKRLPDYGFSEVDIKDITKPVIVYTVRDEDIPSIVKAGNIGEQQQFEMFDNAKRLSSSFRQDSLEALVIGENQSFDDAIRSPENKWIREDFVEALSGSERTGLIDNRGYLKDAGVSAIKRSMAYLAIGGTEYGDRFLKAAFGDAGSLSATVMNAILESVPAIVKLNANIKSGVLPSDYAISDILAKGVTDYTSFMNLPPKDRELDQITIFDTPTATGMDKDLIRFFMNYSSSPKAMKAIISGYVEGALASIATEGQASLLETPTNSTDLFIDVIRRANGQQLKAIKEISDVKSKQYISTINSSVARDWEESLRAPIVKSLREMLSDITPTPADMPDWIRVTGLMSEDVKKSYSNARRVIKGIIEETKLGNIQNVEQRQLILQQAFTRSLATDDAFRKYTGLDGDKFSLNAQANKLLQDINQMKSPLDVWDSKGIGSVPIQQLQNGKEWYGRTRMMRPSEFLGYVPPMGVKTGTTEFLMKAINEGKKLAPPFLDVEWDNANAKWSVINHEGRHRVLAFYGIYGDTPMPVFMSFLGGKRAPDVTDIMLAAPITKQTINTAWGELELEGSLIQMRGQANKLFQDISQMKDDPEKIEQIANDAMKLLGSGAPEDVLNQVIKQAGEKTPVIDEKTAFAELGVDPRRETGIEKTTSLTEQPVRGTSMGRTVPPVRPDGEMFSELSQEIDALLNGFRDEYKNNLGKDYDYPDDIRDLLNKQLPLDQEKLKEKVMASTQLAEQLRLEALVDYSSRYGIDQVVEVLFPYQLWYTRSALAWVKKIITTPAMMALVQRYQEMLERNTLSGFPTRVGGKHMLPYGDDGFLFFSFLEMFYPPEQIFRPLDNFADLNDTLYDDTVSILRSKIISGEITEAEAEEAVKSRNNDIWNSAMVEATAAWQEESGNAVTMTSLAMLPRASFSNAYYMAIGEKEKINPLQVTKLGNMLKGVDPDGIVGVLGEIIGLPENTVRKAAGLSREGQWGEYYVDKKLSELAMSGAYTTDEVIRAMIDRSGEAYDTAARLAQVDMIATSQPGGVVYHAIETQNLDGLMPAIMTALFPKGLYSEAEMKQRGLQSEYNQAWNDFSHGDKEALDNFFEANPEYEARLAIFKEPEERLKEYMIGSIWDAYGALSSADKSLVTDQLGKSFETLFLDNRTRNYDEITTDTLVLWGKQLGAGVPESALTTQQVEPLEYYREDVSAAAQQFSDERNTRFPNWYTLQLTFFELDEDKRPQFKKDFPEFQQYMDWKEEYLKQNPTVADYLEDKGERFDESELTEYGNTTNEWMAQFDPVVASALILYAYGEPLPPAAKSELVKIWEALGKPNGTFDIWLKYGIGH